ncbi:MAG TPA: carboxypeptidase-like regulatory domain-containing protein, partial [Tenuifilaceae bacterium]|nr:carboxypeptidase-like regulatory domain-containing protein [Tenuifilaceae bacterium]
MKKTLLTLVLITWGWVLSAQEITVTGTVISASDGIPLPGVSVTVKANPSIGTATGIDGRYSIKVDANATLLFSFVGMETKEMPVNGQTIINVSMVEATQVLDELVVVGYGIQKK